jgi:protein O-mannosyl-transferase
MYTIVKDSIVHALSHRLSMRVVSSIALVVLVTGAYANSLSGDFVYDDQRVVLANPLLGHWDGHTLSVIFTRDYWGAYYSGTPKASAESSYYRPLVHVYELVAYELAGKNAAGWHWLSILLHALAAILAMLVLDKSLLFATRLPQKTRQLIAAFAAAIFAVHSVQSEAVAWISAFANPLGTVFSLAAFYCYLSYRNRRAYTLLAIGSLLLAAALLTKEIAVVVVLLIAVHELFIFNQQLAMPARLRLTAKTAIAFACVTAAYLAIRYVVLRGLSSDGQNLNFPEDASLTLADNIRTLPALLMAYLKLAILPFNHSMLYDFNYIRSFSFTGFWLPLCLVLSAGSLLLWWGRRVREIRIAAAWILLPLLPHLNTRVFVSEEILHDRYLYLSMIGVALLLSLAAQKAAERLRLSDYSQLSIASAILIVLCAGTLSQNAQWQNESTLWRYAAAQAPNSRVGHLALGALAEARQDYDSALAEYNAALRINPNIIDALNNQAFVYARLERWSEATANFERIVELTPDKAVAHLNLSVAYEMQKRFPEAAREKQRASELGLTMVAKMQSQGSQ